MQHFFFIKPYKLKVKVYAMVTSGGFLNGTVLLTINGKWTGTNLAPCTRFAFYYNQGKQQEIVCWLWLAQFQTWYQYLWKYIILHPTEVIAKQLFLEKVVKFQPVFPNYMWDLDVLFYMVWQKSNIVQKKIADVWIFKTATVYRCQPAVEDASVNAMMLFPPPERRRSRSTSRERERRRRERDRSRDRERDRRRSRSRSPHRRRSRWIFVCWCSCFCV